MGVANQGRPTQLPLPPQHAGQQAGGHLHSLPPAFPGLQQQQPVSIIISDPCDSELPPFAGQPHKWNYWYSQFQALVHTNPNISLTTKMQKVMRSLRGPAQTTALSFDLCDENYGPLINKLMSEFGRPQEICAARMAKVAQFGKIKS